MAADVEANRVSLARALVREPDMLLSDEPFSGLGCVTRLTAQPQLADLWTLHRCTVLLVTHYVEEVQILLDRRGSAESRTCTHQMS